jgi:hypothetical protein
LSPQNDTLCSEEWINRGHEAQTSVFRDDEREMPKNTIYFYRRKQTKILFYVR